MNDFKVGDEVYAVDIFFIKGEIIKNVVTGNLDFYPFQTEYDSPFYRTINYKNEAIDVMIKKLEEMKD